MTDDKKIKQLEKLIAEYEKLSKTKYEFNIDTSNLKQVESQIRVVGRAVKDLKDEAAKLDNTFGNLQGELEGIVKEMGNWGSATSKANKAFKNIADITNRLKYDEKGLSELSKKDLERLQKKLKINKEELVDAAKSIQIKYKITDLTEEAIKNTQDLSEEEAAILRGYLDQFGIIDRINNKTKERLIEEKKIEKQIGLAGKALDGLKKIPILGEILNIDDAKEDMRDLAKQGKGSFEILGKGLSSAFSGLGPLAIIAGIAKAIQMLVGVMFEADKQITDVAKNLNVSKDRASDIRQSFFDIKNSASSFGQIQEGNLILVENLVKTQTELNEALGLSVDLTEEQNRDFLVQLTNANKFLKLEKTETEGLVALFAQTGEEVEDIKNLILGTTKETKILTGFQVNERKILGDVLTTSNSIKLSIKGGTEALIQSTINANKFGISLKDLSSTTSALLNFEQSINDELNAELLLGRDLNLDRARAAALTNDQVVLTEEVGDLIKGFGPDFQRNSIAQEAFAKTLGKSREEIADMYTKYLETEKLRNNQLKLGEDEIKQIKQKANLTVTQESLLRAGKLSGVEFYNILKESGVQSERLTELLAGLSVTSLESQSSQEKFNDALASAKETFTRFVDGKTLDKFANLLTQFINVWQSQGLIAAIMGTGGSEAKKEREKNITSGRSGAEAKKALVIAEQAERGEGSGVNYTREIGGMATGGIVPPGFPNDTYRTRLSSNEAVIPLDQLMAKFDAMANAIASNKQSEPKIYLGYTELNTATSMGTYGLNQGVTS
jgi:hypothetical protein